MTPTDLLTVDDLDAIGHEDHPDRKDPKSLVDRLVRAVDEGRIAEEADRGYALSLAAEIAEEQIEDLDLALTLADRAVDEDRRHGLSEVTPRADRARLLHLVGRADEASTELTELRPLLETDPTATYLIEILEEVGQAELAEQWLTDAVRALLARGPDADDEGHSTAMVYGLVRTRHRLRHDLDRPHDDLDDLADRLDVAADRAADRASATTNGVMFWPEAEFTALVARFPGLTEEFGGTWDDHRRLVERDLVELTEDGVTGLVLVPGSAEAFAAHVADEDLDPLDEDTLDGYVDDHLDAVEGHAWPPGRNDPCWCGSAAKYKKCCLPRSRP
ncbi:SEC-C domain-containing protein [Micromonospora sp. NPDC000207]|uniref:SEC-C domain-containing protein n=1 Tax=Micromonospora sp. NPDC000207 TaxID=3154246 RepID=UPI00332C94BC